MPPKRGSKATVPSKAGKSIDAVRKAPTKKATKPAKRGSERPKSRKTKTAAARKAAAEKAAKKNEETATPPQTASEADGDHMIRSGIHCDPATWDGPDVNLTDFANLPHDDFFPEAQIWADFFPEDHPENDFKLDFDTERIVSKLYGPLEEEPEDESAVDEETDSDRG